MGRAGRTGAAAVVFLVATLAACTAPGGGGGTTTTSSTIPGLPVITAFTASPSSSAAPALVALGWTVSDPEGDTLICDLDVDGDGSSDLTVPACGGTGSRNVTVPVPGSFVPVLSVTDGTNTATRAAAYSVTTGVAETYDIVLRPQSSLSTDQATAFALAEARWESIVVRGVPAATVNVAAGVCGGANGAINQTVDDLVIDIEITAIDGSGDILGQAGPCVVAGDGTSRFGIMQFDEADVATMTATELREVIAHEMAHVIGYGTLWGTSVLSGAGTSDPRFTGSRARAEWSALGRTGTVPVENSGGSGTADAHWRESVFDKELMTGYLDVSPNPLSALTIASLADIGYQVDITRADAYSLPSAALRRAEATTVDRARTILISPLPTVAPPA